MKTGGIILLLFLACLSVRAQKTDKEKALDALIESGMVRRDGSNLIVRVPSYADTARYKLMYSGLITDPNMNLRFETVSSVVVAHEESTLASGAAIHTSGMADVHPSDLSRLAPGQGVPMVPRMKTFGYVGVINPNGSQQFSEHNWSVPDGVTSIKLEGWSAGADGYGASDDAGGSGGAGGYFMSVIEVSPDAIFRIRVPASGKNLYPLVIQSDVGSLTLLSGSCPLREEGGTAQFDARGGYLDRVSGNFEGNTFSIRGQDGERRLAIPLERYTSNLYTYYYHGSKGGDAPRGGSGGAGAIHVSLQEMDVPAGDGSFPGGGGGGGLETTGIQGLESGRGASGFLIIYY